MSEYRNKRVADEIKKILGEIFIRDLPCNDYGLVTVTKVKCSPDLEEAKVYVSIYNHDKEKREQGMHMIISRGSRIRGLLGNRIILRHVPRLHFFEDDTQEYVETIERLFMTLHKEDTETDD